MTKAKLWADGGQDRPAVFNFQNPDRWPAVYAEMLVEKIDDKMASSIASVICGEMRADETFGTLHSFAALTAMLEPLHAELEELDGELSRVFLLSAVSWSADRRPILRHAGLTLELDGATFTRIASALAELAMRTAPVTAAAA